MIKIPIEMPKNCHECNSFGISDLFGFECPATMEHGKYNFFNRPDGCPLRMDKKDDIGETKSTNELKDDLIPQMVNGRTAQRLNG